MFSENKHAAREMMQKYNHNIMGKIALALFKHHRSKEIVYTFDEDAESLYENIFGKYNAQFNLKYSGYYFLNTYVLFITYLYYYNYVHVHIIFLLGDSEIGSQGALDYTEKEEICVHTKASELIGRLPCVLWIYCNDNNFKF